MYFLLCKKSNFILLLLKKQNKKNLVKNISKWKWKPSSIIKNILIGTCIKRFCIFNYNIKNSPFYYWKKKNVGETIQRLPCSTHRTAKSPCEHKGCWSWRKTTFFKAIYISCWWHSLSQQKKLIFRRTLYFIIEHIILPFDSIQTQILLNKLLLT